MLNKAYAYRSSTYLRSNSLYTSMIKIKVAAFLIAPAHLNQGLLCLFWSSFPRFFFHKTYTQQVLPAQSALYRFDE